MQRDNIKKTGLLLLTMAFCLTLFGCGSKEEESTSVSIDKDGKVTNVIYEDFGEDYYDVSELEAMAGEEISTYNSERLSDKVSLDLVESAGDGGSVKMVIVFNDCYDFSGFNNVPLFYGTVQDAIDRGYSVSEGLVDSDGEKLGTDGITENLSKHIIITEDKSDFKAPYDIEYASKGVQLTGKREAVLSSSTEKEIQLLLSK